MRVEARPPAHDAVAPRVHRQEADALGERRLGVGPEVGAAVAPEARVAEEPLDARPCRARRRRRPAPARAGGSRAARVSGEPSVTIPATRSGRRVASTRAKWPPRLWPMMAARWPWRSTSTSTFSSSALDGRLGAVHVHADPGALRVVARAAQPAGHQRERVVAGEEARDQEHGLAAAVLDALAAEDRVAQQASRARALRATRARAAGRERRGSALIRAVRPQYPLGEIGKAPRSAPYRNAPRSFRK